MKKHTRFFLVVSLGFISLSYTAGMERFHLQPHPETKSMMWGGNGAIVNPIPLPQERLFAYVQNPLETTPVLMDFRSGNLRTLDALKKHGFAKMRGPYAFGEDGCLYLVVMPSQHPKMNRYCLQTGSFETIPLEKVADPPFSFVVQKDGTSYGILPVASQDKDFRVVQFNQKGNVLAEKTFPIEGEAVFIWKQPRIRRFFNHNFIFFRDKVYILNEALEIQKKYTLNIPESNGKKVLDVVPFQDASTFFIFLAQTNTIENVIKGEELILWKHEGGQINIDAGSVHGKRILALQSDGTIFWSERHRLGVMKIQADRDLMSQ